MTPAITCARCCELAPWYVAGTLAAADAAAVKAHLAGCADCPREIIFWQVVDETLEEATPQPPAISLEGMTWRAIQRKIEPTGITTLPANHATKESHRKERPIMSERVLDLPAEEPRPSQTTSDAKRWRPYFALAAAVIIIGLSATLFSVFGSQLRQTNTAKNTAACAPSAIKATLPANAHINDISMDSPADGWAVGETLLPAGSAAGALPGSLLLHYQNCVWQVAAPSVPGVAYQSIVMNSPSDGWLVGGKLFGDNAAGIIYRSTFLMRYTGGRWRTVKDNIETGSDSAYLRMSGSNDGWLLTNGGVGYFPALYHWQGHTWDAVTLPDAFQNGRILDMATSDHTLWVVGASDENQAGYGALIGRYANGQWQIWTAPLVNGQEATLNALHLDATGHVWVLGSYSNPAPDATVGANPPVSPASPYILRYNGRTFDVVDAQSVVTPAPNAAHLSVFLSAAIDQPDGGILAFGSGSPLTTSGAPDSNLPNTFVLRCGSSASAGCQYQPFPLPNTTYVDHIAMFSPTQGFAIVHYTIPGQSASHGLAYDDDGSWTLFN